MINVQQKVISSIDQSSMCNIVKPLRVWSGVFVKVFDTTNWVYGKQVTVGTVEEERLGRIYKPKALIAALQCVTTNYHSHDVWIDLDNGYGGSKKSRQTPS
jgi:hypothetical protein